MRTQYAPKRTGPVARGAFTMIELTVVLLVIGLLVALTAGTVVRVMDSQKKSNTQVTLNKLQSQLTKQWSAYKDLYWKENPANVNGGGAWTAVQAMAGGDQRRARVIWVKLRLKQTFPVSFSEALNPAPLPPLPTYQVALGQLGITAATAPNPPAAYESSACLLLALQQSVSGGGAKLEDLGVSSSIQPISAGTGTINIFVDHWNSPLQFCRWPTGDAIPLGNSAAGQPGAANDPGDPEGTLTVQAWQNTYRTQFMNLCHYLPPRTGAAPTSNVVVPLVASCGPDKNLGLNPTDFSSLGAGAENDNIYSRP